VAALPFAGPTGFLSLMYAARLWSVRHARGMRVCYEIFSRYAHYLGPLAGLIGRRRTERMLKPVERATKGFLFDCRMCGQCVLSVTGMACPTNCPKGMRNGPCGGVRADGSCEVDAAMRCIWVEAMQGRKAIGGADVTTDAPVLSPRDYSRTNRSTWIEVISGPGHHAEIHAPAEHVVSAAPASFERACQSGKFLVTVEVAPPDSADPAVLVHCAARFDELTDAINITDGAGGNCHMSSVAASAILAQKGMTPIYQVACRDRNRIAIQGDILGAAALGIRDILCLTGDDVSQGDHPNAKPVFDLDAVALLGIARRMRDEGVYASGRGIAAVPKLFLGATANPFVPPYLDRIANLEKKVGAGAQFIQTQFCFDLDRLQDFMREVRRRELHKRAHILVGVGTLGSVRALRWMVKHVPGVHIPESFLKRIGAAADQKAEAARACIETIQAIAGIEGVAGVHVMGHRNEDVLAQVIIESGIREATPSPIGAES